MSTSITPLQVSTSVWLRIKLIRTLISIITWISELGPPRPARPSFAKRVPVKNGEINVHFYVPPGYGEPGNDKRYGVIVNFFHGGWCAGSPTVDGRWASSILQNAGDTIMCSVGYRLTPEFPFPTGLEDSTTAVLWLFDHADELHLDQFKFGLSGSSAGGAFTIAVPIKLHEMKETGREIPEIKVVMAWYPVLEMKTPMQDKRGKRPDKDLPPFLSAAIDAAYIGTNEHLRDSPHVSPSLAPEELLLAALPRDMVLMLYTCEWDMYMGEAETFRERMKGLGRIVKGRTIPGVPHAWDHPPTWRGPPASAIEMYDEASAEIKRVFHGM